MSIKNILGLEKQIIPILYFDINIEVCSNIFINIFNILLKIGIKKLTNDIGNIIILTNGIKMIFKIIERKFTW